MLDAQLSGSILKKGLDIPFAARKPVGKLKAVVGLDAFHLNTRREYHLTSLLRKSAEE